MDQTEFDAFADEYELEHAHNIKASGESPAFFHEYKVIDVAAALAPASAEACLDILDFGCGVGNSLPYFRRHFPRSRITGTDVSSRSLAVAKQRFPAVANLAQMSSNGSLPFASESFDIAFAACVFHHIPHDEHVALLREWRRILKPGGRAFVFEHNPFNPLTVRAVNTCAFDRNAVLIEPRQLTRALQQAGLSDIRCGYRIFFPHALRRLRPIERSLGWLPLGAQYCASAQRSVG
jgi:SAM-dependent methyltransferase